MGIQEIVGIIPNITSYEAESISIMTEEGDSKAITIARKNYSNTCQNPNSTLLEKIAALIMNERGFYSDKLQALADSIKT